MAIVNPALGTLGGPRGDGETADRSALSALLADYNGNVTDANISASANIDGSKLKNGSIAGGKVDGATSISLNNLNAGGDVTANRLISNAQSYTATWRGGVNSLGGDTWDATTSAGGYANVRGLAFLATSDPDVKTNIAPVAGMLARVQSVDVYGYHLKQHVESDEINGNGPRQVGVMADEIAEAFPQYPGIVGTDENGKPNSVDYGKLAAVALAAVKELSAKVDELEARIGA